MKKSYILGVIGLIIVGVIIGLLVSKKDNTLKGAKVIYMGIFQEMLVETPNYVFKDYDDFSNKFNSSKLSQNDFQTNNYALVTMNYDECSEEDIKIKDYNIKNDKINVFVDYYVKCGLCAPQYMYYLIAIPKNMTNVNVNIEYNSLNDPGCDPNIDYKPIIYLYPEETIDVSIKLGNVNYLTTTYPKYNKSWEIIAKSDGTLIDKKTQREHYALYWEGNNHFVKVQNDGFIVKGEDSIEFLEEKLNLLGLTAREADEFIIYWLPKLENNKYNYIRFETIEEINDYMPLDINPIPDSIIRILMDYKPLDKKIEIEEQKLTTPKREGFTVVEWGGSLID